MKHQFVIAIFCVILFALPGCRKETATSSVSVGPFNVDSETGMANGQAFGIKFKAEGVSGVEVTFELHGNPQNSSVAEITLADDLKIKLETKNDGKSVALQLNGKTFGNLAKGDKVVIGKQRDVTVNGEKRSSK